MVDYMFKHFRRGNVSSDDILILPKVRSEVIDTFRGKNRPKNKTVKYPAESVAARNWSSVKKTFMTAPLLHVGYEIVDRTR
jgi:hypothetical protein